MADRSHHGSQQTLRPTGSPQPPPPGMLFSTIPQRDRRATVSGLEDRLNIVSHKLMQLRDEVVDIVKALPINGCQASFAQTASPGNFTGSQCLTYSTMHENMSHTSANERETGGLHGPDSPALKSTTSKPNTVSEITYPEKQRRGPDTEHIPARLIKTFSLGASGLDEVRPRRKRAYSRNKQNEVKEMRQFGACRPCRMGKRKCNPDHPRSELSGNPRKRSLPKLRKLNGASLHPSPKAHSAKSSGPQLTPEIPPLFAGHEIRRSSLPNLGEPLLDPRSFSTYRRDHGIHKTMSVGSSPELQSNVSLVDPTQFSPDIQSLPTPVIHIQEADESNGPIAWSVPSWNGPHQQAENAEDFSPDQAEVHALERTSTTSQMKALDWQPNINQYPAHSRLDALWSGPEFSEFALLPSCKESTQVASIQPSQQNGYRICGLADLRGIPVSRPTASSSLTGHVDDSRRPPSSLSSASPNLASLGRQFPAHGKSSSMSPNSMTFECIDWGAMLGSPSAAA